MVLSDLKKLDDFNTTLVATTFDRQVFPVSRACWEKTSKRRASYDGERESDREQCKLKSNKQHPTNFNHHACSTKKLLKSHLAGLSGESGDQYRLLKLSNVPLFGLRQIPRGLRFQIN